MPDELLSVVDVLWHGLFCHCGGSTVVGDNHRGESHLGICWANQTLGHASLHVGRSRVNCKNWFQVQVLCHGKLASIPVTCNQFAAWKRKQHVLRLQTPVLDHWELSPHHYELSNEELVMFFFDTLLRQDRSCLVESTKCRWTGKDLCGGCTPPPYLPLAFWPPQRASLESYAKNYPAGAYDENLVCSRRWKHLSLRYGRCTLYSKRMHSLAQEMLPPRGKSMFTLHGHVSPS